MKSNVEGREWKIKSTLKSIENKTNSNEKNKD